MSSDPLVRVLLVGFMGSGKTSAGRLVADRLGWRFVDFDDEIASDAGMSVPEIFRTEGERGFRAREAAAAGRLLAEREVVLASGGGWGAVPGRLQALPAGTESIWLMVTAPTAIERVGTEPGARPLLDRGDALEEASRLLAARDPVYREARWAVDTEQSAVEDVAARILEILVREYPEIFSE